MQLFSFCCLSRTEQNYDVGEVELLAGLRRMVLLAGVSTTPAHCSPFD